MNFCVFTQKLDIVAQQSSRLEITASLADLFAQATAEEAKFMAYLLCAGLGPAYKNLVFGIAEKQMLALLSAFFASTNFAQEFLSAAAGLGDQGEAFCLVRQNQFNQDESSPQSCDDFNITLYAVFCELHAIAMIAGSGAVLQRQAKIHALLARLCPNSSKYVIKIILGKLRLGFSEMTVLESLSWMLTQNKSLKEILETAFNVCADVGLIAQKLKADGINAIQEMSATPGVPIRPAAAERMESVDDIAEKLGRCVAQPKLDGLRIQVHKLLENGTVVVRFFSRNLLDVTHMFPDLEVLVQAFPAENFVAEGEAIAIDPATGAFLPFQTTAKRRRKHAVDEALNEHPLQLYLFDLLFLNNQSLLQKTHAERRQALEILLAQNPATETTLKLIEEQVFFEEEALLRAEKLEEYFEAQLDLGLEGLVVKRPDADYKAGKRNFNWIKLKRLEKTALKDTIDCVIMGYYFGRGKRAGFGIGALLAGIYNETTDSFETVCKIGTGLSDLDLSLYKKLCDEQKVAQKPINFTAAKSLEPDVWVEAKIVVCVRADQISKSPSHTAAKSLQGQGLALRFPRLVALRSDKSAHDATTSAELLRLSQLQRFG